ncbi:MULTISPECIES: hypothetical protein [unclassified Rickettsia]|uniref:hypothetical protein n=1 Tax=unclassified Rickettsia TaxID=114295 RepID=UPI0031331665
MSKYIGFLVEKDALYYSLIYHKTGYFMLAEQQTEWIINNNLVNKGWHIDNSNKKNVYFQKPKLETERKKLNRKKPDYILYIK